MEGFKFVPFLIVLILTAMPHASSAQTTHVVGDSSGWLIPSGGDEAYRAWAASRTFRVGDVLEFNFGIGMHDVAEVSTAAYQSCNSTSPISFSTNGTTRITLASAREYNFICTFGQHCNFGQRLAINVSSSPQPPSPSPSRLARTYTVGDSLGWAIPPGGQVAYETWAETTRFMVGDTLLFNFNGGAHDVVEVTKEEFDSCNISTTTTALITTGPARIPLTTAGEHHYICTFGPHCSLGQKLAVTVVSDGFTITPPSSASPSTPSPPVTVVSDGFTITPPSSASPSTPSPPVTTVPPPKNSATSFGVIVFPFTFLGVALAFFYN